MKISTTKTLFEQIELQEPPCYEIEASSGRVTCLAQRSGNDCGNRMRLIQAKVFLSSVSSVWEKRKFYVCGFGHAHRADDLMLII